MGGVAVKCLVDTGSVFTLVSSQCYQRVCKYRNCEGKLDPFFESVVSANNELLNIMGQVTVPIQIENNVYNQKILVVKDLAHDCLLGTDFLQRNMVTVDFKSMSLDGWQYANINASTQGNI